MVVQQVRGRDSELEREQRIDEAEHDIGRMLRQWRVEAEAREAEERA